MHERVIETIPLDDVQSGEETTLKTIKGFWVNYFKGVTPLDETRANVRSLLGELPKEVQQELEKLIYRPGENASPIILVREEAQKQVNEENRQKALKEAKLRVDERKKPSKGMARHIRRVKAEQRRGRNHS